jgi:tRNA splicing ligase
MKLAEYLDVAKLNRSMADGYVTVRAHNTLPLVIYCYSRKAVYDNHWDDITTKTRGLIVDKDQNIVARPYEKFFAYNTQGRSETYPRSVENVEKEFGTPVITEKVNGCLGIFWKYGTHWGIASKGSFHSPHAEFATKWMEDHIENNGKLVFPEGYTPVFEIICQEVQSHVIKYPADGLVLLNFVNIETGEELSRYDTTLYGAKNSLGYPMLTYLPLKDALENDSDQLEGYVATYNRPGQAPLKLKIKFPTFLKNRKAFYEEQKAKETGDDVRYKEIFDKVASIVKDALVYCTTQKEFAAFFFKPENKFYARGCFALLNYEQDKEKQKRTIWRLVERDTGQRKGSTEGITVTE